MGKLLLFFLLLQVHFSEDLADSLLKKATEMEQKGKFEMARRLLARSALLGNSDAEKRLVEFNKKHEKVLISISKNQEVSKEDQWVNAPGHKNCKIHNPVVKDETIHYKGDCKDGFAHGKGHIRWQSNTGDDHTEYSGELEKGVIHGKGRLRYSSGVYFNGDFEEGLPSGLGTRLYLDGTVQTGEFKKGRFTRGVLILPSGTLFTGKFKHDHLQGLGYLKYPNNTRFIGHFDFGYRSGPGALKLNSAEWIFGVFTNAHRVRLVGKVPFDAKSKEAEFEAETTGFITRMDRGTGFEKF